MEELPKMSLKDKLENSATAAPHRQSGIDGAVANRPLTTASRVDPVTQLRRNAQETLFARIGSRLYDASLSQDQLRTIVVSELNIIIAENDVAFTDDERSRLVHAVSEDVLGYGPIQEYLDDPSVTEIMVNSTESIYIERHGKIEDSGNRFYSADHLRRLIERIAAQVGRRIDEASPMVDARLPDGSRINAVIAPLSIDGPVLTVRKFARHALTIDDLVDIGTITRQLAEFLEACVKGKVSIVVSGGTGTGKTTMLNALSSFIPEDERIISIEDSVELQLQQRHRIRLESRPANVEGKGLVGIRELVRNALRMRPDRIIVGEVRGPEAIDMLQAMNTGHEGSLTTLHANSPRDALARIETMVLMSGLDLPLQAIREQVASGIDLVVHVERLADGTRRIVAVSDVTGMEGATIQLNELFTYDYAAGLDPNGRHRAAIVPTGIRPTFEAKIRRFGVELGADSFRDEHNVVRRTFSR
jgi:pilus assembly protein CpaF